MGGWGDNSQCPMPNAQFAIPYAQSNFIENIKEYLISTGIVMVKA